MDKVFVAKRMTTKLYGAEHALDAALVEAAELMNEMVKARQELKLSATVGQESTAKLIEAMAALGEARTAMMAVHADLDDVRLRLGLRTRMIGIEGKPLAHRESETVLREVG